MSGKRTRNTHGGIYTYTRTRREKNSLSLTHAVFSQTRYTRKPSPLSSKLGQDAPGVSILRPLKGVDLELTDNLISSFEQRYPKFETIFSVAKEDDPAVPVVRQLMKEYPDAECRLIIGDRQVGINPKVNNMVKSYESAKYDIIWILDSNVHVDRDTLGRSVDELMEPGVGLVHHLPVAMQPTSYAAEVEHLFLDTNHAKMYLAINQVGIASCVMGKSNLYRRSDLDRAGGLGAFAQFMAEDNIVGEALWHQGLRHRMSADSACQVLGHITPSEYCRRRARWVRLRKYIVTSATLTEPFTESILCILMGATGANILFGTSIFWYFLFHWCAWFVNDYALYRTLVHTASYARKSHRPLGPCRFARAWLSREVLALPLYLYAMVGTRITWRGQDYHCLRDGTAVPILAKK
ncbi:glucosylceramide synthase [Zychaea mexicana]|uniref:glucosylceramide synthase n=1 Tax=Zychaea mexicana TaxID=64656 RepID=UPI0022FEDEC2|nr:glucosylceramide synthase [Zychaea mexicana]KAI9489440.1 glucosylceramide synthase [Zychaea mexicana]